MGVQYRHTQRGHVALMAVGTVSIFYLIPQMVGAGALIKPLLGLESYLGVTLVGVVVILIVVTAGMVSTTWVQFIKGALLVLFCAVLTVMILQRGLNVERKAGPKDVVRYSQADLKLTGLELVPESGNWKGKPYVRYRNPASGKISVWRDNGPETGDDGGDFVNQAVYVTIKDRKKWINGLPQGDKEGEIDFQPVGTIKLLAPGDSGEERTSTGPLNPFSFFPFLFLFQFLLFLFLRLLL